MLDVETIPRQGEGEVVRRRMLYVLMSECRESVLSKRRELTELSMLIVDFPH